MKQILQNLRTGELEIANVSTPVACPGHLLVKTDCSLISSGTERMLVSFAQSGLLSKAKQQPEKVKQVLDKMKTDGLLPTVHSVFARLDEPLPLGYCNCGTVLDVGDGVKDFQVGDRVVSNGPHAEIVCVPKNLCAQVPDDVTDQQASFTVLASIGLQGIRLLQPTYGETIVVTGLGLIGLMCVQMLRSCGCCVIGIDLDQSKLQLAKEWGAEVIDISAGSDPVQAAMTLTNGHGVDGVLITASAKKDSIIHQSAEMCRKRGRIVLVGVVNMNMDRSDFYEKELSFQVSCSYGPGRYDPLYEQRGQDYPYGFVRWTEQRNFDAILQHMSSGTLQVNELISETYPIEKADAAYKTLTDDPSKMALLLTYPEQPDRRKCIPMESIGDSGKRSESNVVAGLIGAGNFAKLTLLPAIKSASVRLKTVADLNGVAGVHAARKFGFEKATNDYLDVLKDSEINTVFITTRHDLHSGMVIEALRAGKHVHVEKPLCLNATELSEIKKVYAQHESQQLLVGFNRRFSPHAQTMRRLLSSRSTPAAMTCLINAGKIPADTWVQDEKIGGGRIIGEGCHWLDLMSYIIDQPITTVSAVMMGCSPGVDIQSDKMSVTVGFKDGSVGTLHYFANGHKSFPKEKLEVFCGDKILSLDNFRKLKGYGWKNFKKQNLFGQDKGHKGQFCRFIETIAQGKPSMISFGQIENITLASLAAMKSSVDGKVINLESQ